jgi:hypothetical protein
MGSFGARNMGRRVGEVMTIGAEEVVVVVVEEVIVDECDN